MDLRSIPNLISPGRIMVSPNVTPERWWGEEKMSLAEYPSTNSSTGSVVILDILYYQFKESECGGSAEWQMVNHVNLNKGSITQRVSHQNNGISWFWDKIRTRSNFFLFFSYWRCVPGTHLPKTEFLAVVSKMAILSQTVIFDIWWVLPIFGTVTSSFSMENRLLANFPYWNPLRWPLVRDSLRKDEKIQFSS